MRQTARILGLTLLAGFWAVSPAMADTPFSAGTPNLSTPNYPGAPRPVIQDDAAPYAMNYAEEASQRLGVHNGHMDVFSTQPASGGSAIPTFSGGIGSDGAMLKLQWHPDL